MRMEKTRAQHKWRGLHSNAAFSIDSWLVLAKLNRTYVKGGHVNAQLMYMNAQKCARMHSEAHVDVHVKHMGT